MEIFVKNVISTNDYELIIQYESGEIKYIDLKDEIFKYDCWKKLRDVEFFKQAYADEYGDGPCWPENIEMNPIRIYKQSSSINISDIVKNKKQNEQQNKY